MRSLLVLVVAVALFVTPASPSAWGLDVHRHITGHAIDGLPAGLKAFFLPHRDFIVEHSVDPDMWRIVDLRGERGEEPPNHYLDIDGLDDPRPFSNVPREWDAYVAKYGTERANQTGRLPWRIEELYGRLVEAFRQVGAGSPAYAAENARYFVAVLAHYIEDAHQPLHAVVSYDGQATNQRGIHERFETRLAGRILERRTLPPVKIDPVPDVVEYVFEHLIEGESLVGELLDADRRAMAAVGEYNDEYFERFAEGAEAIAMRRMAESANGVASLVVAAWTEAGRPDLPGRAPAGGARR